MRSRAWTPTVVRTSTIERYLDFCMDKNSVSTFISYSRAGGEAENQRDQCREGTLCVEIK